MAPRTFHPRQLATPTSDVFASVAPEIAQAVLKDSEPAETFGNAPDQQTAHTSPCHDSTDTNAPAGVSQCPIPRQCVVPQCLYRPVSSIAWTYSDECTIGRIAFNLKKRMQDKQGVPMSLLVNDRESVVAKALEGASDGVMSDLVLRGICSVKLKIVWPAYPDYCFERNIEIVATDPSSHSAGSISRASLARNIASAFVRFVRLSHMLPLSDDPWEAGFRFGPGALSFGHLWLVSLWHVGGNVFEAEVRHSPIVCNRGVSSKRKELQ